MPAILFAFTNKTAPESDSSWSIPKNDRIDRNDRAVKKLQLSLYLTLIFSVNDLSCLVDSDYFYFKMS